MAARAHAAALAALACAFAPAAARADEDLLVRSRLGAWQLHLDVLVGVEPVEGASAVAFGAEGELLWRNRVGIFAGLLASKGNAIIASVDNGTVLPAPADRVSVPFGLAFHPLGHLGLRPGDGARGWARRLAAGLGLELGVTVEHVRTSAEGETNAGLHLAIALDVPLWGGPVEGGVALRFYGRLIAAPAVSLDAGAAQMPALGGQFYGGLAWAL